jgi:uncharacterized membrane protein
VELQSIIIVLPLSAHSFYFVYRAITVFSMGYKDYL